MYTSGTLSLRVIKIYKWNNSKNINQNQKIKIIKNPRIIIQQNILIKRIFKYDYLVDTFFISNISIYFNKITNQFCQNNLFFIHFHNFIKSKQITKSFSQSTSSLKETINKFIQSAEMITRRKRPLNPLRQRVQQKVIPEFRPKQALPPLDLLADFQFTEKKQIKLSDIDFKILLKDIYPYYTLSSITTCLIIVHVIQFLWQQVHQNNSKMHKYFDKDNMFVSQFWVRLCILIVYTNFLLIIGSYLESVYKIWFIMSYFLSYFIGMLVFLLKLGSLQPYTSTSHIWTATYSIYVLILVEKKMKSSNLTQTWNNIKQLAIWKRISDILSKKQQKQQQTQLIDLSFTQRPLSIKGGQTDDSFSYDSFFSYSDPMDFLSQQRSKTGYFQSNISKRNKFISSFPFQQKPLSIITKFSTDNSIPSNKSFLSSSEIQSTLASSQLTKNEKLQQQQQMIKIYKTIIFSYFVYMNVTKVEWIAYLVSVCGVLGWIQILTNQKLKFIKFSVLALLAVLVISWF